MYKRQDDGIGCALYYPTPLHLQPCFESLGYSIGSLPHAEAAAAEVISLPIAPGIDAVSRERVIERLVAACESQVGWANRRAACARPRRDCQLGSGRSRTGSQIRW